MRHAGTIRNSVAVALFAAAALHSGETPAAESPVAPEADERLLTLAWGGDLTLGSERGNPPDAGRPLLAAVRGALRRADLAGVNYEGTFGPGGASKCGAGRPDCYAFQAPAKNARTLRRAGVDVVNHANNHAFDYGPVGWRATRDALKRAKVGATGAPGEILTLTRGGLRVAFAGFSTYPWTNAMGDEAAVRALIRRAAGQADIVVAFLHAGAEGADKTRVPRGTEHAFGENRGNSRRFARVAIDAGADLVLGSGPHVLRGLEVYKERLIAYSLGNLGGWKTFSTAGRSALSGLLTVTLDADGRFVRGRLDALRLTPAGVPRRDPARASVKLVRSLTRADFPRSPLLIDGRGRLELLDRKDR